MGTTSLAGTSPIKCDDRNSTAEHEKAVTAVYLTLPCEIRVRVINLNSVQSVIEQPLKPLPED